MPQSNGQKPSRLLAIYNQHSAECGTPPCLGNDSGDAYIGYFENPYGEQWVFTFDRDRGEAVLRGGDIGWGNSFRVRDGDAEGLNLTQEKSSWLRACWRAATAGSRSG